MAATLALPVPALLAALAWGVAGLGMGLAFSTNSLVVLEAAQPGQEGTAAAALQLANVLGVAVGAGIGGVIGLAACGGGDDSGDGATAGSSGGGGDDGDHRRLQPGRLRERLACRQHQVHQGRRSRRRTGST